MTAEPGQELEVRRSTAVAALSIDEMVEQVSLIQQAMQKVMKTDEHYGTIPGTNKPTLLKPGAEKLCLLFRLAPSYDLQEIREDDGHYSVRAVCRLTHIPTGNFVGEGTGSCTTHETRYAYRNAQRVCPTCGVPAIIKGKQEYGGGWVCFKRKDGCGAKFQDGDPQIENQEVGKIPNPDLPDTYNTVLKMATKRALVAAVLVSTAASDIFAQDLEDLPAQQPVATADADTLATLRTELEVAASHNDRLWGEPIVCQNAKQRFGRNITRLEDLTQREADQVLAGVRTWMEQQQLTLDDEVLEAEVVNE